MKKAKTVVIEIYVNGTSSMDLQNFHGRGCATVAKDFRGGDSVKLTRTKPEFALQTPPQMQKVSI